MRDTWSRCEILDTYRTLGDHFRGIRSPIVSADLRRKTDVSLTLGSRVNSNKKITQNALCGRAAQGKKSLRVRSHCAAQRFINPTVETPCFCTQRCLDLGSPLRISPSLFRRSRLSRRPPAQPIGIGIQGSWIQCSTGIKDVSEKYCTDCGALIRVRAEICPKCGCRQPMPLWPDQPIARYPVIPWEPDPLVKPMIVLLTFNFLWNGLGNIIIGDKRGWGYGVLNWLVVALSFFTMWVPCLVFFAGCCWQGYLFLHTQQRLLVPPVPLGNSGVVRPEAVDYADTQVSEIRIAPSATSLASQSRRPPLQLSVAAGPKPSRGKWLPIIVVLAAIAVVGTVMFLVGTVSFRNVKRTSSVKVAGRDQSNSMPKYGTKTLGQNHSRRAHSEGLARLRKNRSDVPVYYEPSSRLSIWPESGIQVPLGGSQVFSATLTGTTTVIWTVAGEGCSGDDCGTLSPISWRGSDMHEQQGVYMAPKILPSPPSVIVTATSQPESAAPPASVTVQLIASESSSSH